MYFENGQLRKSKVYIIWGAPASGKSKYVKEHKDPEDVVVDIDRIAAALTLRNEHDERESLLEVICRIRELIYQMIENQEIPCKTIWVIALLPGYMQRERLAERLGGELIHINASEPECIERMENDPTRKDKLRQYEIIEDYFNRLEL